jgi:hypothetical protein
MLTKESQCDPDHRVLRNLGHAEEEQLHHPGDHQGLEHLFGEEENGVS